MDDLDVAAYEAPRGKICDACRKRSDGAKEITDVNAAGAKVTLCGTHYDEWLREEQTVSRGTPPAGRFARVVAFTKRLRGGRYKTCWEASFDDDRG